MQAWLTVELDANFDEDEEAVALGADDEGVTCSGDGGLEVWCGSKCSCAYATIKVAWSYITCLTFILRTRRRGVRD